MKENHSLLYRCYCLINCFINILVQCTNAEDEVFKGEEDQERELQVKY